ncbi:phage tail tape measure protein [Corynebacterium glutamicum]|uniref:Uncharacterized protein n=2 Tax=Corynebacterium glutamicum TaxID=1718 RepID=Q5KRJ6_CORGT|nr:phage tail tape measure protein [Corynebacterium glutamicum]BAD84085.1 hypothetical protein [Corynebacterium glutamicum]BAF54877.1 hypothetical protein cgR_1882 [Corynebacterium glutamicum R]
MAQAAGYAVLPITPSLLGINEELRSQLVAPTQKASKQAGSAIRKEMAAGADQAAKDVEKANFRVKKSAEELATAESKLAEQKLKSEAANKAVEAAARAREEAESKGVAAVEKAEEALLKKRAAAEREARNLVKAEQGVENALTETARAAESLEKRQEALTKATDEGEKSSKSLRDRFREMGDEANSTGGLFDGLAGKVGGLVGAFAGVAGVAGFAGMGKALASETQLINLQLGYTGAAAEGVGDSIKEALKSGVAGSAEEAANAIGSLESQFKWLGAEGEQTAGELSDNFLAFSKVFEVDMAEATQTAGQLIENGLASDVENAADLMTAAMQQVPAQMRDELPEIINEYGTNFRALGFSGEEAFGLLVSAAEKGKFALDKTGDALKEFTIRGADMSKTSVEAYEAIGLNAEEMSRMVATGGEEAQEALMKTAGALQDIEDPAERANTAIALFGTPLEDLSVDQIPDFLDGLTGMGDGMQGVEGASQAMADTIANSLDGRLDRLKGTVQGLAGDAFMWAWDVVENDLLPAFQDLAGWAQDNEKWLKPLAVAVGGMATGMLAWTAATKAYTFAQGLATKSFKLFDGVTKKSMIGMVVMAVTGLVTALIWFFRETELGQEIWANFTSFLKSAWESVSETFGNVVEAISGWWDGLTGDLSAGWESIKSGVFDSWTYTVDTVKSGWESFTDGISSAWNFVKDAFVAGWNAIKDLVFLAFTSYINLIKLEWDIVTGALTFAWNFLKDNFIAGWNLIRDGVFIAWDNAVNNLKAVWDIVTTAVTTAWTVLKDLLVSVWNIIRDAVFTAFSVAAEVLRSSFEVVTNAISTAWDWVKISLNAGYEFIRDTVFGGLKTALDTVKSAFEVARDAIGVAWDGIKAKAAAPVKFVIERVFNDGIVEAWNKVADWVDLPTISKYQPDWLGQFAQGTSRVPGARTPYDNVHMVSTDGRFGISLRGGEGVVVPEVVDALGPDKIDGMNAAAKMGGAQGVLRYLGGFAGGGVIGSISGLVNRFFPGMSITSTLRPGDPGHHGTGNAVDFSNGFDSTPEMRSAAQFFYKNYGPALLELIHSPFSNNVKNGQNVGDGFGLYGAGTMNAHRNHVHVAAAGALPEPGDPITPVPSGGGGGGGVINWLRNRVADVLDGVFDPIGNMIPSFGGLIGDLPKAAFSKMTGAVSDFIRGKAEESGAYFGDVGAGVEQWRPLVISILKAKGFPESLADTTLRRMDQESGGNSRAINNWDSNAAAGIPSKGLMQVIDPTFAAHKDPGFDDIWDPEANIRASMNYAVSRYGSLPAAYNRAGGYHDGGLAGYGRGLLRKTAIEPEMVLNPETTQAFLRWMDTSPESARIVAREISAAFEGGDFGSGETASYIGSRNAERLLDEVSWIGATVDEVKAAWTGGDAGYAGLARYLGGNSELARSILDRVESIGTVTEEISAAWAGGDFGYGELASYVGEPVAKASLDVVAAAGDLHRAFGSLGAAITAQFQAPEVSAEVAGIGRDYLEDQATSLLDVVGLGGLVPFASDMADKHGPALLQSAQDMFGGISVSGSLGPNGATVIIEAESDEDLVRVGQLKALADHVQGLDVQINAKKRPLAAAVTRGGVM